MLVGWERFVVDLRVGLAWLMVVGLMVALLVGAAVWWSVRFLLVDAPVVSSDSVTRSVTSTPAVVASDVVDAGVLASVVSWGESAVREALGEQSRLVGELAVTQGESAALRGELAASVAREGSLRAAFEAAELELLWARGTVRDFRVAESRLVGEVGRLEEQVVALAGEVAVRDAELVALRDQRLMPPPPLPVVDALPLPPMGAVGAFGGVVLPVGLDVFLFDVALKLVDDRFAGELLSGSVLEVLFFSGEEIISQGVLAGGVRVTERLWGNDFGDVVLGGVWLLDGLGWAHERVVASVLTRAFGESTPVSASEFVWRSGAKVFSVSRGDVEGRVVLRVVDDGGASGGLSIFSLPR